MGVYLIFTVTTQSNHLNAKDKLPKKDLNHTFEIYDMEIKKLDK